MKKLKAEELTVEKMTEGIPEWADLPERTRMAFSDLELEIEKAISEYRKVTESAELQLAQVVSYLMETHGVEAVREIEKDEMVLGEEGGEPHPGGRWHYILDDAEEWFSARKRHREMRDRKARGKKR